MRLIACFVYMVCIQRNPESLIESHRDCWESFDVLWNSPNTRSNTTRPQINVICLIHQIWRSPRPSLTSRITIVYYQLDERESPGNYNTIIIIVLGPIMSILGQSLESLYLNVEQMFRWVEGLYVE